MDVHLPTESARRVIRFHELERRFADSNGKTTDWAWREAVAFFQRMIMAGTDQEKAKKLVSRYLANDDKKSRKEKQLFIDEVLFPALDEIAEATLIECKAIIVDQLLSVATSRGGNCSWFDGKTKLEANKYLHDMLSGDSEKLDENKAKGLLLRVVGQNG